LIQWLPNPNGYWRPRNTGRAWTYGVEGELTGGLSLGLSPWSLEGTAGGELLKAVDRETGPTLNKQLPYRPQVKGSLDVTLSHLYGHEIAVTTRIVGARPVTPQNTIWLDPYTAIDLRGTVSIPALRGALTLRVNNVLDLAFVDTRFYPNPGREFVVRMEVHL
jgi:outer membrane receptor protein involved in Fe transport